MIKSRDATKWYYQGAILRRKSWHPQHFIQKNLWFGVRLPKTDIELWDWITATDWQRVSELSSQQKLAIEIRNARMRDGLTQEGLAKILGIARSTIAGWETCKFSLSTHQLTAVKKVLNLKLDEILEAGR